MPPVDQTNQLPYRIRPAKQQSIDGVRHRVAEFEHRSLSGNQPIPGQPVERPRQHHRPARPFQQPLSTAGSERWERLQLPVMVSGGVIAGFFAQSLLLGTCLIMLYGLLSLIFRVHSRVTFTLAFISLLTVAVLLIVKPNAELASNFATYTFLLLVIGVIALIIEARPRGRRKRRTGR